MSCSETDYAYLRKVVLEESANLIDPTRNVLFDARLTPVARTAGAANVEGLVELLRVDRNERLHRAVAEAMTINETSFFRDVRPFEMLRTTALPALMEQRRAERRLTIWSAACSTGQEPYSVAMLLLEHFPQLEEWNVTIVGTDISQPVLDYAARGRYRRNEVNRGLPAKMLVKYFERDGEQWQVAEKVRRLCDFRYANLCAPLPPLPVFDLVLLRNVLLYFPEQDRSCVFGDVHRQMNPKGFLLLGNSEQAEDSTDMFSMEFAADSYFYRPSARY
jgi:chemotaxis protein methyltransferase CheR